MSEFSLRKRYTISNFKPNICTVLYYDLPMQMYGKVGIIYINKRKKKLNKMSAYKYSDWRLNYSTKYVYASAIIRSTYNFDLYCSHVHHRLAQKKNHKTLYVYTYKISVQFFSVCDLFCNLVKKPLIQYKHCTLHMYIPTQKCTSYLVQLK